MKHLRPDEIQLVLDDYAQGLRGTALALKHGVSNTTLYRVLRCAGVPTHAETCGASRKGIGGRKRTVKDTTREGVLAAYRRNPNRTIKQIADEVGCSYHVARQTLNKAVGKLVERKPAPTVDERKQIVLMYRSGLSQAEIALILGRTQVAISRAIRLEGVTLEKLSGERNPQWRGGKVRANGYLFLLVKPDDRFACMRNSMGYVAEHRLVMAKHLGRPLNRTETVHHINGMKSDNRVENLQLRQGQHGNGVVMSCRDCGSRNVAAVELD